jgi:hypothetical protein
LTVDDLSVKNLTIKNSFLNDGWCRSDYLGGGFYGSGCFYSSGCFNNVSNCFDNIGNCFHSGFLGQDANACHYYKAKGQSDFLHLLSKI